MTKLIYYGLVYPFSKLPLCWLFGISRVFVFFVFSVFGYRKMVILENLKKSFPEKNETEILKIAADFYIHFGELFAESLKGFTISEKEILQRFSVKNPELVNDLFKQKKSVILVSGHYNNWEFLVQSLPLHFLHKGVGVGKLISSKGFSNVANKARIRFGMSIWNQNNVRNQFKTHTEKNDLFACLLLADQSPSNIKQAYWMRFLNQDTPVLFGPEYFAKKYDIPVFYYEVLKKKPGYYEMTLVPVTYTPNTTAYGEITYKHTKLLEQTINKNPSQWLWSHKRWKHEKHAADFEVQV